MLICHLSRYLNIDRYLLAKKLTIRYDKVLKYIFLFFYTNIRRLGKYIINRCIYRNIFQCLSYKCKCLLIHFNISIIFVRTFIILALKYLI